MGDSHDHHSHGQSIAQIQGNTPRSRWREKRLVLKIKRTIAHKNIAASKGCEWGNVRTSSN